MQIFGATGNQNIAPTAGRRWTEARTMAEYITKNAAINAVENAPIELFQSEWEEIEEAINAAPAADVAPVVRCKDCKYAYINSFSAASGVALCSSSAKVMQQDDFCSYGERKDGDTDDEV